MRPAPTMPMRTTSASAIALPDGVEHGKAAAQIVEGPSAPGHPVLLDRGVAVVGGRVQRAHDGVEIDQPFTERTEHAGRDRGPEVEPFVRDACQHLRTDVLEVDVPDAIRVPADR